MVISKEVIGFYSKYLSPTLYLSLRYDALTTIAWWGLKLNADGSLFKEYYPPTSMINYAHSKGKKVVLVIYADFFSVSIDNILGKPTVQAILINNIVNEVKQQNFDGVDLDIEGIPEINSVTGTPNRELYTAFVANLSMKLRNANPNYRISIDVPDVDTRSIFDVGQLQNYVDYIMLMAYDYHWMNGPTAGAVAPINNNGGISISQSLNNYLQYMSKDKLILGVPYYGYEWPTESNAREAKTVANGIQTKYKDIIATKISQYPRQWDSIWQSPFYTYQAGSQWYQGWYDDVESLGIKYDLVNQMKLPGIGMWALGFDGTRPELADLIISKFSTSTTIIPSKFPNLSTIILVSVGVLGLVLVAKEIDKRGFNLYG